MSYRAPVPGQPGCYFYSKRQHAQFYEREAADATGLQKMMLLNAARALREEWEQEQWATVESLSKDELLRCKTSIRTQTEKGPSLGIKTRMRRALFSITNGVRVGGKVLLRALWISR